MQSKHQKILCFCCQVATFGVQHLVSLIKRSAYEFSQDQARLIDFKKKRKVFYEISTKRKSSPSSVLWTLPQNVDTEEQLFFRAEDGARGRQALSKPRSPTVIRWKTSHRPAAGRLFANSALRLKDSSARSAPYPKVFQRGFRAGHESTHAGMRARARMRCAVSRPAGGRPAATRPTRPGPSAPRRLILTKRGTRSNDWRSHKESI